jgi:excinuclease ABC subunit A
MKQRLAESFEAALRMADGRAIALEMDTRAASTCSSRFACPVCSYALPELEPRLFSFNSPMGACPHCDGLGQVGVRPRARGGLPVLSLASGAVKGWDRRNAYTFGLLESVARHYGFDIDTPFERWPRARCSRCCCTARASRIEFVYRPSGAGRQAAQRQARAPVRGHPPQLRAALPRDRLGRGARGPGALPGGQALPGLRRHAAAREARHVRLGPGRRGRVPRPSTRSRMRRWPRRWPTSSAAAAGRQGRDRRQGGARDPRAPALPERRGPDYLSLDRSADTLSGGEAQRIRLASQIGSA